jgi:hypothetical protein
MMPQAGKIREERVDVLMVTSYSDEIRYAVTYTVDQT